MMISSKSKTTIYTSAFKASFCAIALALAAPSVSGAQTSAAEEARAAELMCQVGGICGELAATENARTKEFKDGMEVRRMMSIGAINAARPSRNVVVEPVPTNAPSAVVTTSPSSAATYSKPASQAYANATYNSVISNSGSAYSGSATPVTGRAALMVNFALGSAELTGDSLFDIKSFALAIKNMEDQGLVRKYRIEGHADSSGSEAVNLPLSNARAQAVRKMLVEVGVAQDRIDYVGYGSQRPLTGLEPSNSLNRRVEAVLID